MNDTKEQRDSVKETQKQRAGNDEKSDNVERKNGRQMKGERKEWKR